MKFINKTKQKNEWDQQFHTMFFHYCFFGPSSYSRNNWFLTDPTFVVRTKERFCKKCSTNLKMLYKFYISSFEQSGYYTVVTNSESYRVSLKDINALEKSEKGTKWNH